MNMTWIDIYPGPRGFLLFFLGKFCDANCLFAFFLLAWGAKTRHFDQLFASQISKIKKMRLKESLWDQGNFILELSMFFFFFFFFFSEN